MKIAVDISQIVYQGSGVARYTSNLIQALELDSTHEYSYFLSTLRGNLGDDIKRLLENKPVNYFSLPPIALDVLWNRLHITPIENFIGDIDLFITSDWTEPPTKRSKKMTVVHDLVVYKYPETSTQKYDFNIRNLTLRSNIVKTQKRRLSWVKKESNSIVADSKSTSSDLVEILNIPKSKISVVYPGFNPPTIRESSENVLSKYGIIKPYLLTVGKLEPRKNISKLVEAFLELKPSNVDLIIIGPSGWGDVSKRVTPSIKFLGFVPDNDLYQLYKETYGFIMPSLYEGFGYPLVEAMMMGAPCACSSNSSLGEIGKNTCLLFDPTSSGQIKQAIRCLISDSQLRAKLKKQSLNTSRMFSLKRFKDDFVKVINTTLS